MITEFELSVAALDILGEKLEIDLRRFPFEFPSVGQLIEDRERIAEAVWSDLGGRGLASGTRLDADVEDALRLLATGELIVVVFGDQDGEPLLARAAVDGQVAVLAQLREQLVIFRVLEPEAVLRTVVELLGERRAGPGQSITVTEPERPQERRAEDNTERTFRRPVRDLSGLDKNARALRRMLEQPRIGGGCLSVAEYDDLGRERRAPTLGWYDTEAGRYLIQHHPGEDGTPDRTTTTPAGNDRLVQQLCSLVNDLQA